MFTALLISTVQVGVFGQSSIIVTGVVRNNPDVNISVLETSYGTITNETGHYSLEVFAEAEKTQLLFSKIGYRDTIVQLRKEDINIDTILLNITLNKHSYLLPEFKVKSSPYFFSTSNSIILDIEFIDNLLFVLNRKQNRSELILLDENGSVLSVQQVNNKYNEIFRDCFGNYELIGNDSCLQLHYNSLDTSFNAVDKFTTAAFNKKIKPFVLNLGCMFLTKDYFEKNSAIVSKHHNQKVNYYYIDTCKPVKNKKLLVSFFDSVAYNIAASYYSDIISLYYATTPSSQNLIESGVWNGNILKLINNNHRLFNLISWYLSVEAKPVEIDVFVDNNEIIFYNHQNFTILRYNKSFVLMDKGTVFMQNGVKIDNILQDDITGTIYASQLKNGINYIGKFDIKSGKVRKQVKSHTTPFPKIFRIHNNAVYCVYYDSIKRRSTVIRKSLYER